MPFKEETTGHSLYIVSNDVDDKIYVGITMYPRRRWSCHKKEAENGTLNYPLYNAIRKYGIDKFHFDVVESGLTLQQANEREIRLIALYNTRDSRFGYNLAIGGSRVYSTTSEETKRKISIANKGQKRTPEQVESMRERSRKMWKDGVFANMDRSNRKYISKRIICIETGIEYSGMKELLEKMGFSKHIDSHIYDQIHGKIKAYKKYTFMYAEDADNPLQAKVLDN